MLACVWSRLATLISAVKAQKQGRAEQHSALFGNACFQSSFQIVNQCSPFQNAERCCINGCLQAPQQRFDGFSLEL